MITVRPILYTNETSYYRALFDALGARPLVESPGFTVLDLGAGRIALHGLFDGVDEGESSLGFETDDLDAFHASLALPEGMTAERTVAGHGDTVLVTGRDGLTFFVDPRMPGPAGAGTATIHPLWYSADVARAAEDLEALGLRRWITYSRGDGVDLRADEGAVFAHLTQGSPTAEVAISIAPDRLDDSHRALLDTGIDHHVIDETYGRTLRIPMPGTERTLWINSEDDELIGATRHA